MGKRLSIFTYPDHSTSNQVVEMNPTKDPVQESAPRLTRAQRSEINRANWWQMRLEQAERQEERGERKERENEEAFKVWIEENFPDGATPDAQACDRQGYLTMFYLSGHARNERVRLMAAQYLRKSAAQSPSSWTLDRDVSALFNARMQEVEASDEDH